MDWTELEALAQIVDLDVDLLRSAASPALGFDITSPVGDRAGGCRVGGLPWLPDDLEWPTWDPGGYCEAERESARRYMAQQPSTTPHWSGQIARMDALEAGGPLPLSFLLQLDLDELELGGLGLALPPTGVLLVFAELLEGAACMGRAGDPPPWSLVWCPSNQARARRGPPVDREGFVLPERWLEGRPVVTFPEEIHVEGGGGYERYRDEDFDAFLTELEEAGEMGRIQVGGHASRAQGGDLRTEVHFRHQGFDPWTPPPPDRERDLAAGSSAWKFLFQVADGYEEDLGWHGIATFWSRATGGAGLALRDVELHYECT